MLLFDRLRAALHRLPEGGPAYRQAFRRFRRDFPEYATTHALTQLRRRELSRLDTAGHAYLDYTGGGLYPDSLLRRHHALLNRHVFGNPHSSNPSSQAMTALTEEARAAVLRYFGADPAEYTAIFTQNASGALKLLGESFPFAPGSQLLLTEDNHNSVNGIREYARRAGIETIYAPLRPDDLRLDEPALHQLLARPAGAGPRLFALPAQSNFSGVQHPLSWVAEAQAAGWRVLLDAAAYVPTSRLSLGEVRPDFVSVSFYKMFGYPTGMGCLLARREALRELRRPWFAGGTVSMVSVSGDMHQLVGDEAAFEDGTVNYLNIPAVQFGLEFMEELGVDCIKARVRSLTGWLLAELQGLRHPNGAPLVHLLGPTTLNARGGTIAFNLHGPDGRAFPIELVEERANAKNISLRTGCFCNPGAGEAASHLTRAEILAVVQSCASKATLRDMQLGVPDKEVGAVRVSVGYATSFRDVFRLRQYLSGYLGQPAPVRSGPAPVRVEMGA